MSLLEFGLLVPISLFVIVNPFSVVPAFLAMTPGESRQHRLRQARHACILGAALIFLFGLTGQLLFSFLGITLAAFQIAGGALLFVIAFEMLRSPDAQVRLTQEEKDMAREKDDIGITPLGIPLLCGPGAISTVVILQTQAETAWHNVILLGWIPVVYLMFYWILGLSARGAEWLNPIALRVMKRLMGLLFAAIAVQFIINGIGNLPFVVTELEM